MVNFTSGQSTGNFWEDDVITCYLVKKSISKQSFRFVFTPDVTNMMANTYRNTDIVKKCKFHLKLSKNKIHTNSRKIIGLHYTRMHGTEK